MSVFPCGTIVYESLSFTPGKVVSYDPGTKTYLVRTKHGEKKILSRYLFNLQALLIDALEDAKQYARAYSEAMDLDDHDRAEELQQ